MGPRVFLVAMMLLASCTALPPPAEWRPGKKEDRERPRVSSEYQKAKPVAVSRLDWRDALRLARERNPTIAVALERTRQARSILAETRALAYPTVDARASYVRFIEAADFRGRSTSNVSNPTTRTRIFTGRGSDIYSAGVDLSYPLFDGGDAYYARLAAESSLEALRHAARTVEQELELEVSTAYLNVLLSEGAIKIADDTLNFTLEQERQAAARQAAGEGLRIDTLRFKTNASEERLALNRARADRRIRLAVLSELIGVTLEDEVELVRPEGGLEPPGTKTLATAFERRSELHDVQARTRETRRRLLRERSSWWPGLSLFGSYGVISLDDLKISQREDEFQVGSALSMNLFEGGATLARSSRLLHEIEELRREEEALVLRIEREVRDAEAELDVAERNVVVSEETVRLSEEVLESVTAQYRAGEAQVIDVTESTLQRARSQLALLRSRVNLLLSQARLRRAMGLELLGN